ncbi:MAG: hypothetical protein Q8R83_06055 [Legionellaceae bacterium]|nr:hypothetical protein [Legionellaceae bacterium]
MIKTHLGLIVLHHGKNGWSYAPSLSLERLTEVNQENWWNSKKIIVDTKGNNYTRGRIIKALANQDGGAHAADTMDKDYYDLTRMDTSGWVIKDDDGFEGTLDPVPPSIRQIAFETLESFRHIDIAKASRLH